MTASTLDTTQSATAPPRRRARITGLDGLRAVAVLAVVAYHVTPGALVGGYIGVDVFFVVSGFLITLLLLREHSDVGRIDLRRFWARRARRLLPALAATVLVSSTAAVAIGGDVLVGLRRQVLGAATFSSNWLELAFGNDYFDRTSADLFRNLWSLAVEEQFYLVWPLLVIALVAVKRRSWRVAAVLTFAAASAVAMAVLHAPGTDATRVYFGTDTHSFGLAIGAALALAVAGRASDGIAISDRSRRLTDAGMLLALGIIVWAFTALPADDDLVYRGGLAVVAIAVAGVIAGSLVEGSRVATALDTPALRWIGERSYGLYLWHWPVFILLTSALAAWPRSGAHGWALAALATGISFAVAALSYRYLETPIRALGFSGAWRQLTAHSSRRSRTRVIALAAVLLISLTGTSVAIAVSPSTSGAQDEIQEGIDALAATPPAVTPETDDETGADSDSNDAPAPEPTGDQITAIGDSVMLASAPELQAAFPGISIDAAVSRQLSAAPAIIDRMLADETLRPIVVLGLGTNGPIDAEILDALRDRVGSAHQIIVVSVYAPRDWTDGVNSSLDSFARQYRDVELSDWRTAIAAQPALLSSDRVHPGSAGGKLYADALRDALQRLSEIPPLLRPNDYGLAPRPE